MPVSSNAGSFPRQTQNVGCRGGQCMKALKLERELDKNWQQLPVQDPNIIT